MTEKKRHENLNIRMCADTKTEFYTLYYEYKIKHQGASVESFLRYALNAVKEKIRTGNIVGT